MKAMFSQLRIAQKILLVVVVTMSVAVVLTSVALNYYDSKTERALFIENTQLMSRVVAASSTAAVAFLDKKNASGELEALTAMDSLQYACLYSHQMNEVLAIFNRSPVERICEKSESSSIKMNAQHDVIVHQIIERNGLVVGGLYMVAATDKLDERRYKLIQILIFSALISCFVALLMTTWMQRLIYFPIVQLSNTAREITRERSWVTRAEKHSEDELGQLVDTFNEMLERLASDQKQLERMAYFDPLTKLPNRRLLEQRLSRAIARAKRYGRFYAVCFIDLDDFKWVNDTLGHDSGDILLATLADRVLGVIREDDTLARFGGDEFVIVTENISGADSISVLCNKVLETISEPMTLSGQEYECHATIGVALGDGEIGTMYTLLKHADIALYEAKSMGKNTFRIFDESMTVKLKK